MYIDAYTSSSSSSSSSALPTWFFDASKRLNADWKALVQVVGPMMEWQHCIAEELRPMPRECEVMPRKCEVTQRYMALFTKNSQAVGWLEGILRRCKDSGVVEYEVCYGVEVGETLARLKERVEEGLRLRCKNAYVLGSRAV